MRGTSVHEEINDALGLGREAREIHSPREVRACLQAIAAQQVRQRRGTDAGGGASEKLAPCEMKSGLVCRMHRLLKVEGFVHVQNGQSGHRPRGQLRRSGLRRRRVRAFTEEFRRVFREWLQTAAGDVPCLPEERRIPPRKTGRPSTRCIMTSTRAAASGLSAVVRRQ